MKGNLQVGCFKRYTAKPMKPRKEFKEGVREDNWLAGTISKQDLPKGKSCNGNTSLRAHSLTFTCFSWTCVPLILTYLQTCILTAQLPSIWLSSAPIRQEERPLGPAHLLLQFYTTATLLCLSFPHLGHPLDRNAGFIPAEVLLTGNSKICSYLAGWMCTFTENAVLIQRILNIFFPTKWVV